MRLDRPIGAEKLLELRANFARIVRQHPRRAVRQPDAEIAANRGIAGQRLDRPVIADGLSKKRRRLVGERWLGHGSRCPMPDVRCPRRLPLGERRTDNGELISVSVPSHRPSLRG